MKASASTREVGSTGGAGRSAPGAFADAFFFVTFVRFMTFVSLPFAGFVLFVRFVVFRFLTIYLTCSTCN